MQLTPKILLLAISVLSPVLFASQPKERAVTVQGAGAVEHASDQALLRLQFIARDNQVIKAKNKVDAQTQVFTNFVLSKKIAKKDLNNALVRVRAEYPTVEQPTPGFVAEREVTVVFSDLTLYPEVLEFAANLGQVDIQPVELLQSNAIELYDQALIAAIDDAKRKATILAKQSGAKIGKVLTINEQSLGRPMLRKMAMSADSGMETGTQMIRAEVSVEFQLLEP
jgi:uncharacterized protein YggE